LLTQIRAHILSYSTHSTKYLVQLCTLECVYTPAWRHATHDIQHGSRFMHQPSLNPSWTWTLNMRQAPKQILKNLPFLDTNTSTKFSTSLSRGLERPPHDQQVTMTNTFHIRMKNAINRASARPRPTSSWCPLSAPCGPLWLK
jgi:hypothetical protein